MTTHKKAGRKSPKVLTDQVLAILRARRGELVWIDDIVAELERNKIVAGNGSRSAPAVTRALVESAIRQIRQRGLAETFGSAGIEMVNARATRKALAPPTRTRAPVSTKSRIHRYVAKPDDENE